MTNNVFSPFTLPNGNQIKNRVAKAAMEENMGSAERLPNQALFTLYKQWADGGVGLLITGNVMVDRFAMTGPGGIALERDTDLTLFKQWAKTAKANDTKVWMQINHPGRQVYKNMGGKVLAPSAVNMNMGKLSGMFGQPKAMSEAEIDDVIECFVTTATLAQQAGFDGVEVHAAHGYLLSQFLSPLTNKRTDKWGGSLENRARLLLTIVEKIRKNCGRQFDLAVKLNSADFQRGGFDARDAAQVVNMLAKYQLDMVELSGGSYESPALQGRTADDSTLSREAYFLDFSAQIAKNSPVPIMTTGGIRRLPVANKVIDSGIDMVGIAGALSFTPDLVNVWQQRPDFVGPVPEIDWQHKTFRGLAIMAIVKRQLRRLGAGKSAKPALNPYLTMLIDQVRQTKLTKRYRSQLKL